MAPRAQTKTVPTRASASDSEDDLAAVAAISSAENRRATLNGLKATKFKKAMRRASTGKAATKRKAPAKSSQPRQALADRTNLEGGSETEEVEDFAEAEMEGKGKRTRTTAAAGKKKAEEVKPAAKRSRTAKKAPVEPVVPETQQDPDEMEDVEQSVEGALETEMAPAPVKRSYAPRQREGSVQAMLPRPSARSMSAQPGYPAPRERSGSVSGTERERRGGDPELRRKLNDMTRKHENLNLRYQNLQELGKNNAETNFEKLKRASDDKAKSANELIASLKKELAEARRATKTDTSESTALQKQVTTLSTINDKITAENKDLKSKAAQATTDAKAAASEAKALEAKLAAARDQIQQAKTAAPLPSSATEAQREAKLKENLYADLTGLIIRNIKRKDSGDEFDCLQTGRNGSKFPSPIFPLVSCQLTRFQLSTSASRF